MTFQTKSQVAEQLFLLQEQMESLWVYIVFGQDCRVILRAVQEIKERIEYFEEVYSGNVEIVSRPFLTPPEPR